MEDAPNDCNIKAETDGVLFFLHVMSCNECQKRHTVFYAQQLALSGPTLSHRERRILLRSFGAFEYQRFKAVQEWSALEKENRLLKARANDHYRAGQIAERRKIEKEQEDEERERRRARLLLLSQASTVRLRELLASSDESDSEQPSIAGEQPSIAGKQPRE